VVRERMRRRQAPDVDGGQATTVSKARIAVLGFNRPP